jgi:hypothetical protein
MSYLGNTPTQQNFVAGADQFSGTGSQTAFTLSRVVNTVFDIFVTVSNVPQDPFTAYTVAGNTLTFDSAPPSGTNNIDVVYRATNVQYFVPSPGSTVGGPFGIQGNLNFFGTGNRITGDFSNATVANRVAFQTSTVNGNSTPLLLPNGTSTVAGLLAVNNSDPTNASFAGVLALSGAMQVSSGITGTGTYLPMTFLTGGSERMRIDTSGNLQFNSGYGSVAIAYGCRAWVNFNGTGTVAIRASGNVSSITDNGTGSYAVNFTNPMPDVNYAVQLAAGDFSTGFAVIAGPGASNTTSSARVSTWNGGFTTPQDSTYVYVAIFR